eukprot:Awhi_evm2s6133
MNQYLTQSNIAQSLKLLDSEEGENILTTILQMEEEEEDLSNFMNGPSEIITTPTTTTTSTPSPTTLPSTENFFFNQNDLEKFISTELQTTEFQPSTESFNEQHQLNDFSLRNRSLSEPTLPFFQFDVNDSLQLAKRHHSCVESGDFLQFSSTYPEIFSSAPTSVSSTTNLSFITPTGTLDYNEINNNNNITMNPKELSNLSMSKLGNDTHNNGFSLTNLNQNMLSHSTNNIDIDFNSNFNNYTDSASNFDIHQTMSLPSLPLKYSSSLLSPPTTMLTPPTTPTIPMNVKINNNSTSKSLQEKFRSNFFHLKSTPMFTNKDGKSKNVYVINKQLACNMCGRFYSSTSSLRNHVRMKHSLNKKR